MPFCSLVSFYIAQKSDTFLFLSLFAVRPSIYKYFWGSPKTRFGVLRTSTLQTLLGVSPSVRVFGVGASRLRFRASRSRRELTSASRADVRKIHIYIYIYIYIYIVFWDYFLDILAIDLSDAVLLKASAIRGGSSRVSTPGSTESGAMLLPSHSPMKAVVLLRPLKTSVVCGTVPVLALKLTLTRSVTLSRRGVREGSANFGIF